MVYCAAWGCCNRSEKGVRMYGFPADLERRKNWLVRARRSSFIITKDPNSKKICEAHFEADQFTTTKKGKRRLRRDAVPTIFEHHPAVKKRKPPTPRFTPGPVNIKAIAADHSYSKTVPKVEERKGADTEIECKHQRDVATARKETEERKDMAAKKRQEEPTPSCQQALSQSDLLKKLKRQEIITKTAKAELRKTKKENAALKKKMKLSNEKFKQILSQDQIKALGRRTTKGMKWSNDTIKKASEICIATGTAGYKTLQELQIPLPGIRTLQRRMQKIAPEEDTKEKDPPNSSAPPATPTSTNTAPPPSASLVLLTSDL